ncbi:hypothetical protein P6B95_19150 [Streptomyces atratus]|uniref:hypothetical protein n=1 Tax=Streptomyces atratus TaxID=1893 RepID=UPI002AC365C9|nr:hypothetical protein [Streptomyces atratus]WPW29290.1 hypothetical protein P6B95_19150 [Streptomyces atratus]
MVNSSHETNTEFHARVSATPDIPLPDTRAVPQPPAPLLEGTKPKPQERPVDNLLLAEIVELGLGESPAVTTWRNLMAETDLAFFRSETSQRLRMEGRSQGLALGVLLLLAQTGLHVPDEARDRITDCDDMDILTRWLLHAPTASCVDELFDEQRPTL